MSGRKIHWMGLIADLTLQKKRLVNLKTKQWIQSKVKYINIVNQIYGNDNNKKNKNKKNKQKENQKIKIGFIK